MHDSNGCELHYFVMGLDLKKPKRKDLLIGADSMYMLGYYSACIELSPSIRYLSSEFFSSLKETTSARF
jgi:hypothetical protein